MPKLTQSLPRIRKHKASGQAVVYVDGQMIYLGKYGSRIAKQQYDTVIAEWLSQNRSRPNREPEFTSVNDVLLAWVRHAKAFYVKAGKQTEEVGHAKRIARTVKSMYGKLPASTFGPVALQAVRQQFVQEGLARKTVNGHVQRIVRAFKHAAANERIDASIVVALQQVEGLRKRKTEAADYEPIEPVSDAVVQQTLPHLSEVVGDMVRLQRLLGCRPSELCLMRPCDVQKICPSQPQNRTPWICLECHKVKTYRSESKQSGKPDAWKSCTSGLGLGPG